MSRLELKAKRWRQQYKRYVWKVAGIGFGNVKIEYCTLKQLFCVSHSNRCQNIMFQLDFMFVSSFYLSETE